MNRGTTTQLPQRGLWARAVLLLVLAGRLGVAQAEESTTPDADARYRSTLKDALAEYDANHFEEARVLFRRAHEINPNARTLRGIGMASFELRDYVAAVRTLSAALVETRKPLSAEQRTHAQGLART
jgi:tetratricopeptide (TPR) repeat protein